MSNIGTYSVSKPECAKNISNIIIRYFKNKNNLVITDATGGMGGNTISFSQYFKHVNSVELDEMHYEMLENNIRVFGANNIMLINGDYTREYKNIKQHIIYIDPPWGGPDVYTKNNVMLKLGDYDLDEFCNKIHKCSEIVALSLPANFDINTFYNKIKYTNLHVYKIIPNKQILVILTP